MPAFFYHFARIISHIILENRRIRSHFFNVPYFTKKVFSGRYRLADLQKTYFMRG